jgi:predicted ATPase/transcriptional regulator with XRE-family HTH domain
MSKSAVSPEQFPTFGDLLKYLRRREELTQREFAIQVGYSDSQISRLEQNHRVPEAATLMALFVPALHIEREADWVARLLELARHARLEDVPAAEAPVAEAPAAEAPEKPAPKNNLPLSLTTFIGREKEQAEIMRLIGKHRLVTLIGAGGVGKTRTALQVGRNSLGQYPDGAWLVELAPLSDPELLPQTVAAVFRLVTQVEIPCTDLLVEFLRDKTALLILDNCEHLLPACVLLADALLKFCPQLKILATSREALGILGEMHYRLPSLGLPDARQTFEQLRDYESVRLFEERAQLAQPDFQVTPDNAAAVAQICSRLDGIPLAIELAAARVSFFSIDQIALRLEDAVRVGGADAVRAGGAGAVRKASQFDLLTGGSRAELPRQRTLRASIDWSWNLLAESERALLRRLAVFAGGWTLEGAEAVCADRGNAELSASVDAAASAAEGDEPVSELLAKLVAKSLVIPDRQPGFERRFHLHETIRQYAREKLVESGEEPAMRGRHVRYFLAFSRLAEPALHGPQQKEWADRLNNERGNLRAALEHASSADLEAGLYLSANLLWFWRLFDMREGLSWTTLLTQKPEAHAFPHARAKARWTLGEISILMQQFDSVRTIAEECLAVFRAHGDQAGEYDSLMLLAGALQYLEGMSKKNELNLQALALARAMGDPWRQAAALDTLAWDGRNGLQGHAYRQEANALYRQLGDWRNLALNLSLLGHVSISAGNLAAGEKLLDEAEEINQQINNQRDIEFWLIGKSLLYLLRGDDDQARALMQQNIDLQAEVGNRMGYLWARARLAEIALHEGRLAETEQILNEVIAAFHSDRNMSGLAFTLGKRASLHVKNNQPEAAARLIGWSDATLAEIGEIRPRVQQEAVERDSAAIIAAIGAPAYDAAYNLGCKMTLDEAVQ